MRSDFGGGLANEEIMLGLNLIPNPRIGIPIPANPPLFIISSHRNPIRPSHRLPITIRPQIQSASRRIEARAENEEQNGAGSGNGEEDGVKKPSFNLKWGELLLNPDPDNVAAVGLAGLLTWASVQVVWQLVAVSLAILLAALKYSFIAALLLFILITLL